MELSPSPLESRELRQTGKICLRLAFPESISAFRRKDPIEVGSGCSEAHLKEYFEQLIPDAVFVVEKDRIQREDSVTIRDVEHLFYYNEFRKVFPNGLDQHERFSTDFSSWPVIRMGRQSRRRSAR
jgi:asparagine synthase (glutamine-hydrolysing)